jgi:hypothetical protein
MTLQTMTASVQSMIRNNPKVTTADIQGWINEAIAMMSRYGETFDDHYNFFSIAGQREYNLPDNLIKLKEPVMYNSQVLQKISLWEAMQLYSSYWAVITPPSLMIGVPDRYYIRKTSSTLSTTPGTSATNFLDLGAGKNVIGFYFTPNDQQVVDIFGTFLPGDLVNTTDSPGFDSDWHPMIVDYALWRAYLKLMDQPMAIGFQKNWEKKLLELKHASHSDPEYVNAGTPDAMSD